MPDVVKVTQTVTVVRLVRPPTQRVVVTAPPPQNRVTTVRVPQRVVVHGIGLPGPAGPAGADGAGGPATTLLHEQGTPAATWTVPHPFGRYVQVFLMDSTGEQMFADVEQIVGQVSVTFPVPTSGYALLT